MATIRTFGDNIAEQSSTVGNGIYQLDGPLEGYRAFSADFVLNDTPYYAVRNATETKYEYNKGTTVYTPGGPATLSRATWLSSNGNAPVVWESDDLPLTIYIPTSGEIMEAMLTGWLSTTRNAMIQFGTWWKKDSAATGQHILNCYAGGSDTPIGHGNAVQGVAQLFGIPRRGGLSGCGTIQQSNTDITVNIGVVMDSTNTVAMVLNSALRKKSSGSWVIGNNANGMGTGLTIAASTWYHVFVGLINGIADVFFDNNSGASHKPTGCTHFRRVWSAKTDASANWLFYTQFGDRCIWGLSVSEVAGTVYQVSWLALGVGTLQGVPPISGVVWNGSIWASCSAGWGLSFYPVGFQLVANDYSLVGNAGGQAGAEYSIYTGSNATFLMTSAASSPFPTIQQITTRGYIDRRGQDV